MTDNKIQMDALGIQHLPAEIVVLILSFLPTLAQVVRTSVLCRRWRNLWHYVTCLDLDATTVLPMHQLKQIHAQRYVEWVNKVIDARAANPGLPFVKEFRIWFGLNASQGCHIDRWIGYAIDNKVEKLHLDFSPYNNNILPDNQYKLSEGCWLRAPSGPASLKSLKSLFLHTVNVSKQFIEFILSSCPLLEDLSLTFAGNYRNLNISGMPPLRLKRLNSILYEDFVITVLEAPYLTSLTYRTGKFHPHKVDVPMLTDLTIGSLCCRQSVMDYLDPFGSYLPQLENLELIMERAERFRLNKMPELVKLKYLKIRIAFGGSDTISSEILNFVNICSSLDTFALEVQEESCSPLSVNQIGREPNQKQEWPKEDSFRCLKTLKLHGANMKTIDQRVMKCIIGSAPHLKKLILYTRRSYIKPDLEPPNLQLVKDLEVRAKELCLWSCADIDVTVIS